MLRSSGWRSRRTACRALRVMLCAPRRCAACARRAPRAARGGAHHPASFHRPDPIPHPPHTHILPHKHTPELRHLRRRARHEQHDHRPQLLAAGAKDLVRGGHQHRVALADDAAQVLVHRLHVPQHGLHDLLEQLRRRGPLQARQGRGGSRGLAANWHDHSRSPRRGRVLAAAAAAAAAGAAAAKSHEAAFAHAGEVPRGALQRGSPAGAAVLRCAAAQAPPLCLACREHGGAAAGSRISYKSYASN